MRKLIIAPALVLLATSAFAQTANNESVGGGKTTSSKPTTTTTKPPPKKPAPKRTSSVGTSNSDKPVSSPCGVYYKNRADMMAESNLPNQWFSLGQSSNNHFWYNPRKTNCDAQTGVLKTWIKEEHKNTDGDFALVLYEMKCHSDQLRVRTVIQYDRPGNVLETTNHDTDEPFQDVAPGTAGVTMLNTACRKPQ
jgi:surface-adhesin protein E